MFHVMEMAVGDRKKWGGVHSLDAVLPSKIHRIKGVLANVVPDNGVLLSGTGTIVKGEQYDETGLYDYNFSESGKPKVTQVGVASLAIDGVLIIAEAVPAYTCKAMRGSTMTDCLRSIEPVSIPQGAVVRLTMEETLNDPFVKKADAFVKDIVDKFCANKSDDEIRAALENYTKWIDRTHDMEWGLGSWTFGSSVDYVKKRAIELMLDAFIRGKGGNGYKLRMYIDYD
jgi:hypothetical protein